MNDLWSLIRNIAEVFGMIAIPVFTWVIYTIMQQGKQIIVLEQKVNDSLHQRLITVEHKVTAVEEKIDTIAQNILECRMIASDTHHMHKQISSQIDNLVTIVNNKK
jgi:hypothetical protein